MQRDMPTYILDSDGVTLRTAKFYDSAGNLLILGLSSSLPPAPDPTSGLRWHKTAVFQNEMPYNLFGGKWTDAQVQAQAKAFDLISVQTKAPPTYLSFYTQAQLDTLRSLNPAFKMVVYNNAGESHSAVAYPEAYHAHNAAGQQLANLTWGTYPMQPDNAGWISTTIALGQTVMAPVTYDGQFCDVLGDYPLALNPVKPGTSTLYTQAEWYALTSALAAAFVSANPGKVIIANGLGWGSKYMSASKVLFTHAGGVPMAVAESFVRTSSLSTDARALSYWNDEIAMLDHASGLGKIVICITKDWTTASAALKDERLKFAFGTFMMANNGTHYFAASTSQAATMDVHPWLSTINYGTPNGARVMDVNGVYTRDFSNASIAVNPTTTSRTITLRSVTGVVVAPSRAVFIVDQT